MTMDKRTILALPNDELRIKVAELDGWTGIGVLNDGIPYGKPPEHWNPPIDDPDPTDKTNVWCLSDYPSNIGLAMDHLFESVYGRGGKIKDGAWVLGTVHNGRDCAHACLMWKDKSFTKFRPLKVEVDCPRGEMARAITLCWVCAMLGVNDVS